jgi:N-acetylmuramoyl-L-alanine amidase
MPRKLSHLCFIIPALSIATLACGASPAAQRNRDAFTTVVIDAGHGGSDRGGIPGQRIPEKEMTLDVAQRLKALLAASGYRVVMTRDSDVFVPWRRVLQSRIRIVTPFSSASISTRQTNGREWNRNIFL